MKMKKVEDPKYSDSVGHDDKQSAGLDGKETLYSSSTLFPRNKRAITVMMHFAPGLLLDSKLDYL